MPVGSETIVAGSYSATWNSVALGLFENDAGLPVLEQQSSSEPVMGGAYGKSVIDDVYQGLNVFIALTCMEYKSGPISAFWPYSATLGRMGTIGVLMYTLSQALVLTAVAGTSAASSPATLTASKAILMPGFASRLVYGPTVRKVPLRFRCYPFDSGGNVTFWTQT